MPLIPLLFILKSIYHNYIIFYCVDIYLEACIILFVSVSIYIMYLCALYIMHLSVLYYNWRVNNNFFLQNLCFHRIMTFICINTSSMDRFFISKKKKIHG